MATLKQQPVKTPTFSQKYSDVEYRQKYGTGQAATIARIKAVMTHRGRTPTAGRLLDIYKRRGKEFNTRGYGALREWAGPSKAAPGGGGKKKPTLAEARANALRDAIGAINAQFGFNRAELAGQMGEVGNFFRMGSADIAQQKQQASRAAIEDAVRRGIMQSSIYAQNRADVIKEAADAKARLTQEYGTRTTVGKAGSRARDIESALKTLGTQKAAAINEARATSAKGQLDLESLLALIGVGIQGTNFAGAAG